MQKVTYTFALFFSIIVLFASSVQAQCNQTEIKRLINREIRPYAFETSSVMNFEPNEDLPDVIESQLTFYKGEQYRVIVYTDKIDRGIDYKLYYISSNGDKQLVKGGRESNNLFVFDFEAINTGKHLLEFKANESSDNGLEFRCISFALGYLY